MKHVFRVLSVSYKRTYDHCSDELCRLEIILLTYLQYGTGTVRHTVGYVTCICAVLCSQCCEPNDSCVESFSAVSLVVNTWSLGLSGVVVNSPGQEVLGSHPAPVTILYDAIR